MAPETLQLCIGAQVMLLKNLDIPNGLANGSRGIVLGFVSDMPKVRFLNGEERIIDYNIWEVEENGKEILRAKQVPLKVAYAISIHKSQGCSLDYAEIDLSNIFEYGQAYVALSRVKSLEGLSIIDIDYDYINAHPTATEYYENL
jgi:ATP-dependent DNA helicase PIF1